MQKEIIELEIEILSNLIFAPNYLGEILDILFPDFFSTEANRIIFKTLTGLHHEKKKIDYLILRDELLKKYPVPEHLKTHK